MNDSSYIDERNYDERFSFLLLYLEKYLKYLNCMYENDKYLNNFNSVESQATD